MEATKKLEGIESSLQGAYYLEEIRCMTDNTEE
jgi:hypothetical protein